MGIMELIMDACLIGMGVCLAVIGYNLHVGYTEIKEKYFSTEAQLRRAVGNWQRNQTSALEQFKDEVRKATRR